MNRETKTIKTPVGQKEVVINSYMTGREKRELFKQDGDKNYDTKSIKMCVMSIDGNKENILDNVLDMHGKDYDFVLDEITNTLNDSSFLVQKTEKK